ncbi:MAG: GDP-mannose 4,6-dehydratase [Candidatus Pacearchaeota archaeon]|nr:GDP-mannose 4,6-dehydratase [Candidatus Pacearchaeota archaeon]
MKKILLTGGAGFIGYHLAKHLANQEDVKIILADNLWRGQMDEDLKELLKNEKVEFLEADVTDPKFYESLSKDFDQVYHLAAVNGTKLFYEIPQEVLRINTLSLIYLLEWARNLDKKPKICFTSSNEAYAGALSAFNSLPIPTPEAVPLIIEDTYNPRWSYGATKAIGEMFVIYYSKAYNIPAVIVRPHNFYGPRAGFGHVIPQMSERITKKENPFIVYGSDETRTFCYITDAVEAMQILMDSPVTDKIPAETFHIGATDEINMLDLAKKLFEVTGYNPEKLDIKPGLAGSVKRRLADITKIKSSVKWEPRTSLDEGLKKTYEWYKNKF